MNEKVMVNEKLKCILYTIFSNYNNLSKKIYIVLDDSKKDEVLDILNSGESDYITFASSSTVTNFVDIIGKENIDKLNELKVISIGPITTQTAKSLNINVYSEAEVSTIDGMIYSIMNDK